MSELHAGDRIYMSEIGMTIGIESQKIWNRVSESELEVRARSEIKARVRIFSNYIPEFEIQIPDPEHGRIVQNGNSGPTVMGRPT